MLPFAKFEKYSEEDDTNTYEKITLYNEENTKEYLKDYNID